MPSDVMTWYFKAADGAVNGPLPADGLRERVVSGDITAETPVSPDRKAWRPALSFPECGFDCLVLRTEPALDVLGPFSRAFLDRPEIMQTLPPDGQFFVRSGTVADASSLPSARPSSSGETGAALVERILAAESALRESDKARRAAEAALKARDLEFESERARLSSEIAALKAEALRREAEAEGLRADSAKREAREREALAAEARLVDVERESAARLSELEALRADVAKMRAAASEGATESKAKDRKIAALEAEAASARDAAEWIRGELSRVASEAGKRLAGTMGSAVPAKAAEPPLVEAEPVEPEVLPPETPEKDERKSATRRPGAKDRTGGAAASAPAADGERVSRMAALESQLRKELQMAGAASSGGALPLRNLFKKK